VDLITWANENAGVLTLTFVALTFLALLETRAGRIASTASAHVAARPEPYVFVRRTMLVLRLRNHGPAVAEDVWLTLSWREGAEPVGRTKTLMEPVMGVGDEVLYHPTLLLADPKDEPALADLGDRGLTLQVNVTWLDERRYLFAPWLRVRTRRPYDHSMADYSDSVHDGPLVLPKDVIREELEGIKDELKRTNDRATQRDMRDHPWEPDNAEVRAVFEHTRARAWLRLQRGLWLARLKVWTGRGN
jgi:hypothetical protein